MIRFVVGSVYLELVIQVGCIDFEDLMTSVVGSRGR